MLRLEVPLEQRNQDVRVAVVVESSRPFTDEGAIEDRSAAIDPWSAYRTKLQAAGLRIPAPGSWTLRQAEPLCFDGPSASQTLVEDRR